MNPDKKGVAPVQETTPKIETENNPTAAQPSLQAIHHIWENEISWAWLELPEGPRNYVARLHVCTKGVRGGIREVVVELGAKELRATAQVSIQTTEELEALMLKDFGTL